MPEERGALGGKRLKPQGNSGARKAEESHVRDVEQSSRRPGSQMFGGDTGVPYRQLDAVEINDVRAQFDMLIIKRGADQ